MWNGNNIKKQGMECG